MRLEAKEWGKASRRSHKKKSGGVHVYVNSSALRYAGIPPNVDLEVKQYGLEDMKVLLKFRKVKK